MIENDDDLAQLFSLDDEPGPAKKLSRAEEDALIAAVLAPKKVLPRFMGIAAAAAVILFASGAVAAVWFATRVPEVVPPAVVVEQPKKVVIAPRKLVIPPEVRVEELPAEPTKSAKKASEPEDLLAKANELRGQKNWSAAEKTYSRVVRAYPRSQAAYVAAIAAAALRLEHLDDAQGALLLYEKARRLAPKGALDADILFGIAGAHRALGEREEEKRALSHLLRKYPKSVFAPGAQKRIAELEAAR